MIQKNLSTVDRILRVVAGAFLCALWAWMPAASYWAWLALAGGLALLLNALLGRCWLYAACKITSKRRDPSDPSEGS